MSPLSPTCAAFDEVAAELALGLLVGEERAAAVAHVESCDRCRRRLVELTAAADRLVEIAPSVEPPPGFEQRILAAIAPAAPTNRSRWRPYLAPGIAAAVALAVAVGALVAVGRNSSAERETAMIAPNGVDVGDVYLHDGSPAWVFVTVPEWTDRWGGKQYTLRVTQRDGSVRDVAGGDLANGSGAWGTALPMPADAVRSVSLLGADGRVWCTGTFT